MSKEICEIVGWYKNSMVKMTKNRNEKLYKIDKKTVVNGKLIDSIVRYI